MNQDIRLSSEIRDQLVGQIRDDLRRYGQAQDAFDEAVANRLGVNRTDLRCLDILERLEPMTAGDLARESGLTTGAVTAVLDRLERGGFARRVRDTEDRRRVLVEVVPAALVPLGAISGPLAEEVGRSLAECTDNELVFLRDFMRRGQAFLTEHTARVKTDNPADA
jgi:DNA-binding MarR family transcriptional regulator